MARQLILTRAKADGRWAQACDGAKTSAVPDDLAAALDANLQAMAFARSCGSDGGELGRLVCFAAGAAGRPMDD